MAAVLLLWSQLATVGNERRIVVRVRLPDPLREHPQPDIPALSVRGGECPPTHVSRDRINRELEAIGNVWPDRQRKGWLLCDAVVRDSFPELIVKIRNLSRGRASISGISLHPELTDLSDD